MAAVVRVLIASASALTTLVGGAALAERPELRLPGPGTPYEGARKALLDQGLAIAPDAVDHPHNSFPELNCPEGPAGHCEALFIWRDEDGWGHYVEVGVDGGAHQIVYATLAPAVSGHISAPPAESLDVPSVAGPYLQARAELQRLGYRPLRVTGLMEYACLDDDCRNVLPLPEAQCAMSPPLCNTFWQAPNGRVLNVVTAGEFHGGAAGGNINYKAWATPEQISELAK